MNGPGFLDASKMLKGIARRGRNACEKKVEGPSSQLPSGADLCDILFQPSSQCLRVSVTDRSDFYHQIAVARARALTNTLGPGFPAELVSSTKTFEIFTLQSSLKRSRLSHGDGLFVRKQPKKTKPGILYAAFDSILQGDHAGVEFACAAHSQLLRDFGLLGSSLNVVGSGPTLSEDQFQGLVIDDFFSVSIEPKGSSQASLSAKAFDVAQEAYSKYGLLGSPEKDVRDAPKAKVIGAEVSADETALRFRCPSVSAPATKRFGLSWISLQISQLSHTTDSLHLSLLGGWTSILMYRRPMMSILQHSFNLVPSNEIEQGHAKLVPLPRTVASELVLLSVLAPLIKTDISAPYASELFATDASSTRGAVVSTEVNRDTYEALFRCCKSKGSYTRLLSNEEHLFCQVGFGSFPQDFESPRIPKPLAFRFAFIEIFAGSAKVTRFVSEAGYSVGPPIDLSVSSEFDLCSQHVASWLTWLVSEQLILGFMIEPPCTTFSIMRRPPLRDVWHPYGFDPKHEQTAVGNQLGQRGFQMLFIGRRNRVVGLLEAPNSSKLKNMPSWKALAGHPDVFSTRCDSCRYGSIHLKSFKFLTVGMRLSHAALRCKCTQPHVPVQGAYTKLSATYTDLLAQALARDFVCAFESLLLEDVESDDVDVKGMENQLVNDVAISSSWKVQSSWIFKKPSHINLLELKSLLRLFSDLVKRKRSLRFVAFVDSIVTRGAVAKGRSSSFAVASILRQICALSVAGGLYAVTPFVPTRHNVADDPTRDRPPRPPCPGLNLHRWPRPLLFSLARIPSLNRWASNWVRLCLFLIDPVCVIPFDRTGLRKPRLDFDKTLGYPGEGPQWISLCLLVLVPVTCVLVLRVCGRPVGSCGCGNRFLFLLLLSQGRECHGVYIAPRNDADRLRAVSRSALGPLPTGRQVLPLTQSNREVFLAAFFSWCRSQDLQIDEIFENSWSHLEDINRILVAYGRALYESGRPHSHYIECINAVVGHRPILRRNLQEAWDLGFSWVRQEPSAHHVAAPFQVVLAMLTTCLVWGWTRTAGAIAFCFGGLLRPGEMISAVRRQLLLPSDVANSVPYALMSILEPKTRFRAARHQYSKVDIPDLLKVIEIAFARAPKSGKLWPFSGQTLRLRFQSVMKAIGLPLTARGGMKPLRAGGATWLMQTTESSDFVQRRGRWINGRVMNIYLQETTALQYLKGLPQDSIDRLMFLAQAFPETLEKADLFTRCLIPTSSWFILFSRPS